MKMTAEEFCRFLWQKYLVERRYDILGEVVDGQISVIGTGAHEVSRNLEEFIVSMGHESTEWDGTFLIKSQWYQTVELSDEISLVFGELVAKEDAEDGILYDVRFRFSAVLRRDGDGWRLVHMHQSVPDPNQALDEFFPHRMVEENGQQIIYNLRHDSMTGLLNRRYLKETAARMMATDPNGRMLMMDIDDFKQLNDTFGHPFGDRVLILFAQSLKFSFAQGVLGRVGGDEFVVYIPGRMSREECEGLLQAFKKDWKDSQDSLKLPFDITTSIGVSESTEAVNTYDQVWKKADDALYLAKKSGKNKICYDN